MRTTGMAGGFHMRLEGCCRQRPGKNKGSQVESRRFYIMLRIVSFSMLAIMFVYTTFFYGYFGGTVVTFNSDSIKLRYTTINQLVKKGFSIRPKLDQLLDTVQMPPATFLVNRSNPRPKGFLPDNGIELTGNGISIVVHPINDSRRDKKYLKNCPIYKITWYTKNNPQSLTIQSETFSANMDLDAVRNALPHYKETMVNGQTCFYLPNHISFFVDFDEAGKLKAVSVGGIPNEIKSGTSDQLLYSAMAFSILAVLQWILSRKKKRTA
ncbi:MAG: hypothetical protein LIP28_05920 [Deltaproteobacteria bacterium]|nr:hypothetical protein [Deltaproteobacteria bacterium]